MKQRLNFEPKWLTVTIFFLAGVFGGCFVLFIWIFNGGSIYGIQIGNYKLINPLLAVESQQTQFFQNYGLQKQLNGLVDKAKKNQDVTQASIYFRDIEKGRWLGINEDTKFSPGKLTKIPIMIAYYKKAESDPKILDKMIVFHHTNPDPLTTDDLTEGESYSVDELIRQMIINDDESSANILFDNIDQVTLNEVFSDLGMDFKEDNKFADDYLTIKQYSLIYRVLYNSTYLNRTNSEKALTLLTETPNNGIATSIPNDIKIAHKYKSRKLTDKSNINEAHDCAIIYYPDHPYVLCVAMLGRDQEAINNLIKEVSTAVYADMDATYKSK
jgi:hypothetical protein